MRARTGSVLLMAVLAGIVGLGPAPAEQLVVIRDGRALTVPVSRQRGYSAARAAGLAQALGFAWSGSTMEINGESVNFSIGSPFFTVGDEVHQLPNPAYRVGSDVMVPLSWALDWLPRTHSRRWEIVW